MAVVRGRISEGIDFSDNLARAVFIVGIPYPPLNNPYVILKKYYLNKNVDKFAGDKWYKQQATSSVN